MELLNNYALQETLAELSIRLQKQEETLKMMAKLQINMAQTVMSHHLAVTALISTLEKSAPELTKNLRLNLDAQYESASAEDTKAALIKAMAMLSPLK